MRGGREWERRKGRKGREAGGKHCTDMVWNCQEINAILMKMTGPLHCLPLFSFRILWNEQEHKSRSLRKSVRALNSVQVLGKFKPDITPCDHVRSLPYASQHVSFLFLSHARVTKTKKDFQNPRDRSQRNTITSMRSPSWDLIIQKIAHNFNSWLLTQSSYGLDTLKTVAATEQSWDCPTRRLAKNLTN